MGIFSVCHIQSNIIYLKTSKKIFFLFFSWITNLNSYEVPEDSGCWHLINILLTEFSQKRKEKKKVLSLNFFLMNTL